jgi:hypothetical protein
MAGVPVVVPVCVVPARLGPKQLVSSIDVAIVAAVKMFFFIVLFYFG